MTPRRRPDREIILRRRAYVLWYRTGGHHRRAGVPDRGGVQGLEHPVQQRDQRHHHRADQRDGSVRGPDGELRQQLHLLRRQLLHPVLRGRHAGQAVRLQRRRLEDRQDRGGQVRHQVRPGGLYRRGRHPGVRRHLHVRHLLRPAAPGQAYLQRDPHPLVHVARHHHRAHHRAGAHDPRRPPEPQHHPHPGPGHRPDGRPGDGRRVHRGLLRHLRRLLRLGAQACPEGGVEAGLPAPCGRVGRRRQL